MRSIVSACFLAALLGQLMSAEAELSQTANWPGLGDLLDLGSVLPATPAFYSGTPPTDGCDTSPCTGSMATSTASFGDSDHTILLCMCEGAQEDINALAYGMSKVPLFIRQFVNSITSIPAASTSAYTFTGTGRITVFGSVDAFDLFIHESAHAQDQGFSSSDAYTNALAADTCVPDEYARTNQVECYAQDMVVFLYQLWKKTTPSPGTACMSNQLSAIQNSNAPGLQDYINSVP